MFTNSFGDPQTPATNGYKDFNTSSFVGAKIIHKGDDPYALRQRDYFHRRSMIYFIYVWIEGQMVLTYVGKTIQNSARILQHIDRENMPVHRWFFIDVPEDLLDEVERYYIETYQPLLNFVDNPTYMHSNGRYTMSKSEAHKMKTEFTETLNAIIAIEKGERKPSALPLYDTSPNENGTKVFRLLPENL